MTPVTGPLALTATQDLGNIPSYTDPLESNIVITRKRKGGVVSASRELLNLSLAQPASVYYVAILVFSIVG